MYILQTVFPKRVHLESAGIQHVHGLFPVGILVVVRSARANQDIIPVMADIHHRGRLVTPSHAGVYTRAEVIFAQEITVTVVCLSILDTV